MSFLDTQKIPNFTFLTFGYTSGISCWFWTNEFYFSCQVSFLRLTCIKVVYLLSFIFVPNKICKFVVICFYEYLFQMLLIPKNISISIQRCQLCSKAYKEKLLVRSTSNNIYRWMKKEMIGDFMNISLWFTSLLVSFQNRSFILDWSLNSWKTSSFFIKSNSKFS